jgi:prepilin peptidase CpaA
VQLDPATVVPIALLAVLARIAWTDVRARRIGNAAVVAVLALALLRLLLDRSAGPWHAHAMAALLVLGPGLLAWRAGLLGGGDVKLAAALALLVGADALPRLLLLTALCGGALALLQLLGRHAGWLVAFGLGRLLPAGLAGRLAGVLPAAPGAAPPTVPYGVALGLAGAAWALRQLATA